MTLSPEIAIVAATIRPLHVALAAWYKADKENRHAVARRIATDLPGFEFVEFFNLANARDA